MVVVKMSWLGLQVRIAHALRWKDVRRSRSRMCWTASGRDCGVAGGWVGKWVIDGRAGEE